MGLFPGATALHVPVDAVFRQEMWVNVHKPYCLTANMRSRKAEDILGKNEEELTPLRVVTVGDMVSCLANRVFPNACSTSRYSME